MCVWGGGGGGCKDALFVFTVSTCTNGFLEGLANYMTCVGT